MVLVTLIIASRRFTLYCEPPLGQIIGHLGTGSNHHGERNVLMTPETVMEGQTNTVISDLFMSGTHLAYSYDPGNGFMQDTDSDPLIL
jgi:hypothetical protein